MPNIREYTSDQAPPKPTETGIDAFAAAGRRLGAFYNQVASGIQQTGADVGAAVKDIGEKVEKAEAFREISHGAAGLAQKRVEWISTWDDMNGKADPNDPTVAAKFNNEVLNPQLAQFQTAFRTEKGKAWALSQLDATREHFFQKTYADRASAADKAVRVDVKQLFNADSNSAYLSPDFHTLDALHKSGKDTINTMVDASNVKGTAAVQMKTELLEQYYEQTTKWGAMGAVQKSNDPEATALAYTQRYPKYINGAEAAAFAKEGVRQRKLMMAEDRAQRVEEDRQAKNAWNKAANDFEISTTRENLDTGLVEPVSPRGLREKLNQMLLKHRDGAAQEPTRVASLYHRLEDLGRKLDETSKANMERVSDQTKKYLMNKINAGPDDPNRLLSTDLIEKMYNTDNLTWQARKDLLAEYVKARTPDGEQLNDRLKTFLAAIKPQIDRSNPLQGKVFPLDTESFYRYETDLRRDMANARTRGQDQWDLITSGKPDYRGHPDALRPYQKPMQQTMEEQLKIIRGRATQGKPVTGAPVEPPRAPFVPVIPGRSYP